MMNNIEWKEGAVCYANGEQWFASDGTGMLWSSGRVVSCKLLTERHQDFQLNEPKQGDYLSKSELDTEQKYNDAVEVFGLFGAKRGFTVGDYERLELLDGGIYESLVFHEVEGSMCLGVARIEKNYLHQSQLAHNQLMAIGKLKRLMNERKGEENAIQDSVKSKIDDWLDKPLTSDAFSGEKFHSLDLSEKPKRRNKSKQAYDILKSLDYEYDLVKQCWYRKEYIN